MLFVSSKQSTQYIKKNKTTEIFIVSSKSNKNGTEKLIELLKFEQIKLYFLTADEIWHFLIIFDSLLEVENIRY